MKQSIAHFAHTTFEHMHIGTRARRRDAKIAELGAPCPSIVPWHIELGETPRALKIRISSLPIDFPESNKRERSKKL